jgi:hypothetical protein
MHLGAQRARLAQVAEGQLARVDADAFRLVQRAGRFLVVHILAPDRVGVEDAGVIMEDLPHDLGFFFQRRHGFRLVGDVQVAARLRVAVDVGRDLLERFHRIAHFRVQFERFPGRSGLSTASASGGPSCIAPGRRCACCSPS